VETIVDKKPEIEVSKEEPTPSTVSLFESKPNQPLFSSVATEESSEEETRTTLLNDLLDDHEERKTRRKWITTACVFGGALLLVVFQLIHYTSAAKIKHIVNTPQPAVSSPEPDTVTDAILNSKLAASKPSAAKPNSETQPQPQPEQVESASVKSPDKVPAASQTRLMETQLAAPTRLPQNAKSGAAGDAPPPSSLGGASMAALSGNNAMGSVFSAGSNAKVSGPRVVSVSAGVAVGMLVHQTPALYPPIAKSARVQGTVVLNATISKTGKVTNVRVLSGPPMLRQSAIDAVKTWQYKPYMLNNEPTDAETTINVAFSLGG
jgi:protein TonB